MDNIRIKPILRATMLLGDAQYSKGCRIESALADHAFYARLLVGLAHDAYDFRAGGRLAKENILPALIKSGVVFRSQPKKLHHLRRGAHIHLQLPVQQYVTERKLLTVTGRAPAHLYAIQVAFATSIFSIVQMVVVPHCAPCYSCGFPA